MQAGRRQRAGQRRTVGVPRRRPAPPGLRLRLRLGLHLRCFRAARARTCRVSGARARRRRRQPPPPPRRASRLCLRPRGSGSGGDSRARCSGSADCPAREGDCAPGLGAHRASSLFAGDETSSKFGFRGEPVEAGRGRGARTRDGTGSRSFRAVGAFSLILGGTARRRGGLGKGLVRVLTIE